MEVTDASKAVRASAGASATAIRTTGRSPVRPGLFYPGVTLFLIGLVIAGFWRSYFGPLLAASVDRHWLIHLHASIFVGWMALLLVQVALVSARRVRAHRRLGMLGIAVGALVLASGLTVSFAAPVLHVRAGEWTADQAAGFLLLPLVDMVLFAGFFGAAIAFRRKPEIHKRLILAATVALAFAAVGRLPIRSELALLAIWLSPLLAAMIVDLYARGRVHRTHVISLVVLAAASCRIAFTESAAWLRVGHMLLSIFL